MNIAQLQAFVDTKPDLRELSNVIVDFLQDNPDGGGNYDPASFPAADTLTGAEIIPIVQSGTNKKATVNDLLPVQLQGDKSIDLNGKTLDFVQGGADFLLLNPVAFQSSIQATDGTATSVFLNTADLGANQVFFDIISSTGVDDVEIFGDAVAKTISYTADAHTFNGKIITPDLVDLDFADDAAAAIGGVAVGQWYHNSGTLKLRIA